MVVNRLFWLSWLVVQIPATLRELFWEILVPRSA
jgi:hypothetical protein